MNKKFMVVALMAALSTVGYAVTDADFTNLRNDVSDLGDTVGKLNSEIVKVDQKFQGQIDGKASQSDLTNLRNDVSDLGDTVGKLNSAMVDADKNLQDQIDGKASQSDLTNLRNDVSDLGDTVTDLNEAMVNADKNLQDQINTNKEELGKLDEKVDNVKHEIYVESSKVHDRIDDLNEAVVKEDQKLQAQIDQNKADQKVTDDAQDGKIETNKNNIAANAEKIEALQQNFAQYDGRLSGLEKKVDHLDDKMNKGLSLMAAMNAVDFQNVQTGEMALGAGVGHYGNAQSVALGVAYSPVEDLTVNAKYSVTAGDADSFAVGAGATYKFKVGR